MHGGVLLTQVADFVLDALFADHEALALHAQAVQLDFADDRLHFDRKGKGEGPLARKVFGAIEAGHGHGLQVEVGQGLLVTFAHQLADQILEDFLAKTLRDDGARDMTLAEPLDDGVVRKFIEQFVEFGLNDLGRGDHLEFFFGRAFLILRYIESSHGGHPFT